MSNVKYAGILSFAFLLSISFAQAQSTESSSQSEFKISANYNSGLNYYGRTDSLRSSGFFPMAELWFNKNVYVNAAPVFVNNSATSFDYAGTVATLGFLSVTDEWITSLTLMKPFYNTNELVQSALKAQTALSFTNRNEIMNFSFGGDFKFSDKVDYGAMLGLDHAFVVPFSTEKSLIINPTVTANAGTQQFSYTHYKQSSFLGLPGPRQEVTESVKKFNILSYEFSMPVILTSGKLQLMVSPAYVIPQNLISVTGRPDLSERGKEMFYSTFTAKITL
jgi:hypothetical protein